MTTEKDCRSEKAAIKYYHMALGKTLDILTRPNNYKHYTLVMVSNYTPGCQRNVKNPRRSYVSTITHPKDQLCVYHFGAEHRGRNNRR